MVLYLVKGYLDVAATSLADAQSLITALADQTDPDNLNTIAKVTAKLETLVQSDNGEPLVISSIDDAAGTISSWVTDTATTLAIGLGDPDTNNNAVYASTVNTAIAGSTRTATLALNTTNLASAVSRGRCTGPQGLQASTFTLQIQKTTAGLTETVAMLLVRVLPAVMTSTPADYTPTSYVTTAAARAGYLINLSGVTSLTGGGSTTLDGQDAGGASFPVGCLACTSDGIAGNGVRFWKLLSGTLAATNLALFQIKPTNYSAATPMYWQG